ncbi:DUF2312 domain-containing protein [Rhizobium sp. Root483D2]|uniref:DUF2312 domain-containing protein n=1 Tax=Rhizobium sp. Root483D2 TaxID=1736545 RepID=UPI0009E9E9B4|nr:DUF2312 domain-containing protein [Rhizobium sp. Root483D2]
MSAEAQIKSFIERIIRLKDEQDAIGEDIKAVYAEAKSLGFDKTGLGDVVTHLRKIEKKGADTIAEKEAIFDIYLSAYQGPQARASARTRENIEEFDAETGEIIDRDARRRARMSESMDDTKALSAEAVALGLISEKGHAETVAIADAVARKFGNGPLNTRSDAPPASAAAVISSSNDTATGEAGSPVGLPENSPETADDVTRPAALAVPGGEPSIPSPDDGGVKMDGGSNRYPGRSDETVGIESTQSGQAVTTPKPAPSMDELRIANALILRPNCRRPGQETCGGQGRVHCRDCMAAPVEREREEA